MSADGDLDMAGDDLTDSDIRYRVVGTTTGGKDIVIVPTRHGKHEVKFVGGGELPVRLQGTFCRYEDAVPEIEVYLFLERKKNAQVARSKRKSYSKTKVNTDTDSE